MSATTIRASREVAVSTESKTTSVYAAQAGPARAAREVGHELTSTQ